MTPEYAIVILKKLPNGVLDLEIWQKWELENAAKLAITALRTSTLEHVNKTRGEWRPIHGLSEYYCSRCGEEFEIHSYDKDNYKFCPNCASPMTADAVDILWKRLEAMQDAAD